ncbi:aminotransferase class V-fold PLP-dependent enzyme [Nonomuraea aurantiaca]|jgi:selenocysteine lyase/cysteine desulfurase|uniref:aminotransferase class V-fold PLP-dependent enzyme n=1 Tax=Nonomuraea aurantiaca TaxID=2878562 RepID=UPI001CD958FD|nr:aminotransferase class V-fold PLP-dependent enzyme [Nonomuraea aurantiaca]MCA2221062.1 aminotransferase class V-fold PLP-dependent enzyme [Nonomuraea aurantiaca]
MIDLARARELTPGTANTVHLNNAGASLPSSAVLEATVGHLRLEAEIGGYEAADRATDRVEAAYDSAARLLNCSRDEIAIVDSATRAWDLAFYAIRFRPGDRILTSKAEYASNFIAYLQVARRHGVSVEVVPNDGLGQLSVDALRAMMDERVRLISVTHIPTNGGLVNPAAEIGKIAAEAGVLYLLDACQSVGQIPVDVEQIRCDMLSTTGRKYLRAPRGTGLLYVRRTVLDQLDPPFLDLRSAKWTAPGRFEIQPGARRFENWEYGVAGRVGLATAVEEALAWGLDDIRDSVYLLGDTLRERLAAVPGCIVRDVGAERCGIVTFTLDGVTADTIKTFMAERRINVSVSRAPSTLLDMTDRDISELVRASVHYYNSEEELNLLCEELTRLSA